HDADLVKRIAQATAQEMAATGIYWNFGPCITVPQDERWGRTYEGFSESAELVVRLGTAAIEGYQGNDLADPGSVMATAKHFVADGGTLRGRDQGNARIDEEELRRIHLFPYEKAIDASVGSIMASFSSWNGEKVHGSEYLLTQLLKEEMGFQGLLVSDWKALEQLPGSYNDQVAAGINAGINMVMVPDNYPRFIETLTKLVEQEKVPLERIDDAVRRILKAKMELSLWQRPLAQRQFLSSVGSEEHRTLAREAVRKSMVLLKNDGILPLSENLRGVIITGALADNLGAQCGGWTISWQGEQGDITPGTTIKEALSSRLGPDVPLYHSLQDAGENPVDAMIMVLGEMPYAEMMGDREDLTIPYAQILPIQQAKEQGIPVITILISGRPMILGELLNLSDGLIAAWLPGSEGAGVTDVIFGDFNPTGKLSYTWPRSMDQIPINLGDEDYDPLFPFGYGLSY
ncbi:MAG: glycoside hydrolase family 3 C-terminal domain-containing protein, partial [Spirochaetaceae bacterium]|nr:glycoside hydrolase family 3 C-terminal domain-containing protein [Spirochaetaceae bacterium]